jgi:integrase
MTDSNTTGSYKATSKLENNHQAAPPKLARQNAHDNLTELEARQKSNIASNNAKLAELGLLGPNGKRSKQLISQTPSKRQRCRGGPRPTTGGASRDQPKRAAKRPITDLTAVDRPVAGAVDQITRGEACANLEALSKWPSKVLTLTFRKAVNDKEELTFNLKALHDPLQSCPVRATQFAMREVWMLLLPKVGSSTFKKEMSPSSTFMMTKAPSSTTTACSEEVALLKRALSPSVCGARARGLALGGADLVAAWLRHHDKGGLAATIELQLPGALATALLGSQLKSHAPTTSAPDQLIDGVVATGPDTALLAPKPKPPANELAPLTRRYGLTKANTPPALVIELEACKGYWTRPIEVTRQSRQGKPMGVSTWELRETLVKLFLGYCNLMHDVEPKLSLYSKVSLLQDYLQWLEARAAHRQAQKADGMNDVDTSANNAMQHIATAISIAKFLEKDNAKRGKGFSGISYIEELRTLMGQARHKASLAKQPTLGSTPKNWASLLELDAMRTKLEMLVKPESSALLEACNTAKGKKQWANNFQDLVLVWLWTLCPPTRSQVVRSLQCLPLSHKGQENRLSWHEEKKTWVMYFPVHKTCATKKTDMLPLPNRLNKAIANYIEHAVPILAAQAPPSASTAKTTTGTQACGPGRPLLLNKHGGGFGKQNFTVYAQSMFQRHLGKKIKPHTLRKIYVTDLYNRPTTMQEKLSWASAMGQTIRTQEETYNLQGRMELVAPAMEDIENQIIVRAANAATTASLGAAKLNAGPLGAHANDNQEWQVEKVLNVRAHTSGKQAGKTLNGSLSSVKVQWRPSWVAPESLSPAALKEAQAMLPLKKRKLASR